MAVIMANNMPQSVVLGFSEFEEMKSSRMKLVGVIVDKIITENIEVLRKLAE
jgi:hypothetical protein